METESPFSLLTILGRNLLSFVKTIQFNFLHSTLKGTIKTFLYVLCLLWASKYIFHSWNHVINYKTSITKNIKIPHKNNAIFGIIEKAAMFCIWKNENMKCNAPANIR